MNNLNVIILPLLGAILSNLAYGKELPTTEEFQGLLQGCAVGAHIEISADLLGSITSIYKGDKTQGKTLISSQTEFLKLIPEKDRLKAYELYTRCISNFIKGDQKGIIRNSTILDNQGSPTLVLKSFPEDRDFMKYALKPENQIGLAEVGAEVNVIEERETKLPFMKASKVLFLSGRLKNQTGWVSSNTLRLVQLSDDRESP